MIPSAVLDHLIESGQREAILAHDGNLSFGFRLRLRRLLAKSFIDDRYAILCFHSASKLVPRWNQLRLEGTYQRLPVQLLAVCRESVLKMRSTTELRRKLFHFRNYLEGVPFDGVESEFPPSYAHFAAYAAAATALNYPVIEVFQEKDTEFDLDPDLLDTHAFVAMDAAGALWDAKSDPHARREYWRCFLTNEMPNVLSETNVTRLIDESLISSG